MNRDLFSVSSSAIDSLYLSYRPQYSELVPEEPHILFFDQSYHLRPNFVSLSDYYSLMHLLFCQLVASGLPVFFKLHPDVTSYPNFLEPFRSSVSLIPSSIPSQYLVNNSSIIISITSGSLCKAPFSLTRISLVHLIPFASNSIYKKSLEVLHRKKDNFVHCPETIEDLTLLIQQ